MSDGVPESFFHGVYEAEAPWDIGRAQPMVVDLLDRGVLRGRVLDVGCGTGDNAILLARRGCEVTAVDFVARAVEIARARAAQADANVDFRVHDALRLDPLGRFDVVLDSALLHTFDDARRVEYARSVASVLAPGGRLVVLCFSDQEPGTQGPRRVSQGEIRATFAEHFTTDSIEPGRFLDRLRSEGAHAWMALLTRR